MILSKCRADFPELGGRDARTEQAGQDGFGFVLAPFGDQIAGALRDQKQSDQKHSSGHRLHEIHPAPGFDPEPEIGSRNASPRSKDIIDDERSGEAGDDHDLLQCRQPPTDLGRSDWRYRPAKARSPRRRPFPRRMRAINVDRAESPQKPWTKSADQGRAAAAASIIVSCG